MTYADIRAKIHLLTKTNTTSLASASLNLYTQPAEDRVVSLINGADSLWQFDDSNNSDLPIATTNLVSGQQDYSLATTHLTIDRVDVKDTSGNWTPLTQIDQQTLKRDRSQAMSSYQSTNGIPTEYDVLGSSVLLYPTPNFSQNASLKIYFTRGPLKFDYTLGTFTDTTGSTASNPGWNSLFHDLIPLLASYDYCSTNGLKNASNLLVMIQSKEEELKNFYGLRNRDYRPRFTISTDSNK